MISPKRPERRGIDEYTLAAYLAGGLGNARRREVASFLSKNDDARELLLAAKELLDAEGDGHSRSPHRLLAVVDKPPREKPFLTPVRRLNVLFWSAVVLLAVSAIGTTSFIALQVGIEVGQREAWSQLAPTPPGEELTVSGSMDAVAWSAVPDAETYRVVVWNSTLEQSVLEAVTAETNLGLEMLPSLEDSGVPLQIWVDALGTDGARLSRTRPLSVRPQLSGSSTP